MHTRTIYIYIYIYIHIYIYIYKYKYIYRYRYLYIHTYYILWTKVLYPVFRQSFVSSLPNPNSPEGEAPGVAPRLPASRSAPGRPWHCTCPPPCREAPVAPVAYITIPQHPPLPGPKEDQGVLSIQILPEETHHLADVQSASALSGATSGPFLLEFLGEKHGMVHPKKWSSSEGWKGCFFLNNQMGDLIDQNMGCKHDFHFFWIWRPNMRIARCHPDWRETNWRSSVQSFWPACNTLPPESKYRKDKLI